MAIDPAKDAPLADRPSLEPAAQRPDRTCRFFSSKRDCAGRAGPFAVGFRAPDREHDPLGLEAQVGDLERDELAAAQGRRPADEQQRPIAPPAQVVGDGKHHRAECVQARAPSSAAAPRRVGGGCRARYLFYTIAKKRVASVNNALRV
jgi:hypothetical protein